MGGCISEEFFYTWAVPCMQRIARELHARHPTVPLLVFPRGATYSLATLQQAGYDCVTMDTHTARAATRDMLRDAALVQQVLPDTGLAAEKRTWPASVQGNFDVALLRGGEGARTVAEVSDAVKEMLVALGPQALIANLGEGLTGKEDPELVEAFVDAVHRESEAMIQTSS